MEEEAGHRHDKVGWDGGKGTVRTAPAISQHPKSMATATTSTSSSSHMLMGVGRIPTKQDPQTSTSTAPVAPFAIEPEEELEVEVTAKNPMKPLNISSLKRQKLQPKGITMDQRTQAARSTVVLSAFSVVLSRCYALYVHVP